MQSFVLTLIPAAVVVAIAHFTAGALFRPDPEKANPKNLRAKILVVDLLAALVAIAVVQLAAGGLLKPEPPATFPSSSLYSFSIPSGILFHLHVLNDRRSYL